MKFNKYFQKHSVAREWIESIVIAFLIAMVIRTFVLQAFKIPTGSMRTTLLKGTGFSSINWCMALKSLLRIGAFPDTGN